MTETVVTCKFSEDASVGEFTRLVNRSDTMIQFMDSPPNGILGYWALRLAEMLPHCEAAEIKGVTDPNILCKWTGKWMTIIKACAIPALQIGTVEEDLTALGVGIVCIRGSLFVIAHEGDCYLQTNQGRMLKNASTGKLKLINPDAKNDSLVCVFMYHKGTLIADSV